MVICAIIGCSYRSGRDNALVKFHRVPSVRSNCTPAMKTLSANRRALWLLRICREDLDDARAAKNGSRVCSRHFVSGAPAILEDITNPDWAPSLHLGHDFFDGKRKLRKRKEHVNKCMCNSYVPRSKYQRNYRKNLMKKKSTVDDTSGVSKNACCYMNPEESDDSQIEGSNDSQIEGSDDSQIEGSDDDTSCARKNACCYMNADESNDSENEESVSSPEFEMSDISESNTDVKESSLITVKPEKSTINESITHITVTSENTGSLLIQPNYARSILKPKYVRNLVNPEHAPNTNIHLEDMPSTHTSEEVEFKTETDIESDNVILTTSESKGNYFDDDSSESAQKEYSHEIDNKCTQRTSSESISEQKSFNVSGQISCATHAEAFSTAETLLRYIMNQDEVNDVDLNFILNIAKKIKEKMH